MTDPGPSDVVRVRDLEASLPAREFAHPGSRLLRRRRRLVLLVLIVVGGSVWFSAAYALYLSSDYYRDAFTRRLSEQVGLTVTCRDLRRVDWTARELTRLRATLDDGAPVFECDRALWSRGDAELQEGFVLDLIDGWMLVGDADWPASRYEKLLRSSLGQNFAAMSLSRARLRDIDLKFATPIGVLSLADTRGVVNLDPDGEAVASLDGFELNGVAVDEPMNIAARFTPGDDLTFSQAALTIPGVPLRAFAFYDPNVDAGTPGSFDGFISYELSKQARIVDLVGAVREADLAALTRGMPSGPIRGRIELDIRQARFEDESLEVLRASGRAVELHLSDVASELAANDVPATLSLDVADVRWKRDTIEYLKTTGEARNVSLEALTSLAEAGRVTGTARLDIESLTIVDDRVTHADVTMEAEAPPDGPGTIDRAVLAYAATQWFGMDLSAILPAEVTYERLGVRVIIEGDDLRVTGTHGADGSTILTVRLFDSPVELLSAPERVFPAPDVVDLARSLLADLQLEQRSSSFTSDRSEGRSESEGR